MSRIRNIKPTFFKDETIAELPREIRLFFVGLWTLCDLRGVVECRPRFFKVELFPYDDDIEGSAIERWLDALEVLGRIRRFRHEEREFVFVVRFKDHQAVSSRETKIGTSLPDPSVATFRPISIAAATAPDEVFNEYQPHEDTTVHERVHAPDRSGTCAGQGDLGRRTMDIGHRTSDVGRRTSEQITTTSDDGERRHATTIILHRVNGVDAAAVRQAVKAGDLLALVRAFNANADRAEEWHRDADGMTLAMVAVIFAAARRRREPIREPSGFRSALAVQRAQGGVGRVEAEELLREYGLKPPRPQEPVQEASA